MIKTGCSAEVAFTVTEALTAKAVGSGTLDVLATPVMIANMEKAAWTAVAADLPPESGTVGIRMEVSHVSPTPLGLTVTCRAELTKAEGRRLYFKVSAFDEAGLIGEGTHERAVIQSESFMGKAEKKRKKQ